MCGFHGCTAGYQIGREVLSHRGPDHYGSFANEDVLLEHWRLSIIDLSTNGNQPMRLGSDDDYVMAYNGEVYNFKELRERVKDAEYHSTTDTEVVLNLYERFRLDCFRELNGMFALAIYDRPSQRIVLARDRFGIKPLYYYVDSRGEIAFASELKALLCNTMVEVTLDPAAIRSLFHHLYIEGERTPFNEIKKLPPGSYLIYCLRTKQVQVAKYHDFHFASHDLPRSRCLNRIDELLAESVRMHLVSDVPVGALLSGGVDSSLMVALMTRYAPQVLTYSVGYQDSALFDESRYFNVVAERFRTTHHHTQLGEGDLTALVDQVCGILDEPVGDTSVFLNYYIFGFVARSVKVCLSGLGGDELFAGYNRYLAVKFLPSYFRLPLASRRLIGTLISAIPSSRHSKIGNRLRLIKTFLKNADKDVGRSYCNFVDYFSDMKDEPIRGVGRFVNEPFDAYWDEAFVEEANRIFKYDLENYMVNDLLLLTDRMSMAHSLEARVPFLENNLVDFALSIRPERKIRGWTLKVLLKEVAQRYLPREVIFRRKQGFSSPVSGLLSHASLDELSYELREGQEEYVEILNRELFLQMILRHRERREDFSLQIFTLLVYLKWMGHVSARFGVARANGGWSS